MEVEIEIEVPDMFEFELWRQDDNGNRFLVSTFPVFDDAEAKRRELEGKGHKQHYWVESVEKARPEP